MKLRIARKVAKRTMMYVRGGVMFGTVVPWDQWYRMSTILAAYRVTNRRRERELTGIW